MTRRSARREGQEEGEGAVKGGGFGAPKANGKANGKKASGPPASRRRTGSEVDEAMELERETRTDDEGDDDDSSSSAELSESTTKRRDDPVPGSREFHDWCRSRSRRSSRAAATGR